MLPGECLPHYLVMICAPAWNDVRLRSVPRYCCFSIHEVSVSVERFSLDGPAQGTLVSLACQGDCRWDNADVAADRQIVERS